MYQYHTDMPIYWYIGIGMILVYTYYWYRYQFDLNPEPDISISICLISILLGKIGIGFLYISMTISVEPIIGIIRYIKLSIPTVVDSCISQSVIILYIIKKSKVNIIKVYC